jgi:Domain of unknown function (DUF4145)
MIAGCSSLFVGGLCREIPPSRVISRQVQGSRMKNDRLVCPWCSREVTPTWNEVDVEYQVEPSGDTYPGDKIHVACCPSCLKRLLYFEWGRYPGRTTERIYPTGHQARRAPSQVPADIAQDYNEAMAVLELSPKASATLSRRCLQQLLNFKGYTAENLYGQVRALLDETDLNKRLPEAVRAVVDAIRQFGNFGAHPIHDTETLKMIDVEPYEAEFCLELLNALFEYYFVTPDRQEQERQRIESKVRQGGKELQR